MAGSTAIYVVIVNGTTLAVLAGLTVYATTSSWVTADGCAALAAAAHVLVSIGASTHRYRELDRVHQSMPPKP